MARLSKQEQELKAIEQFQSWFDRIDKYIKMLVVFVFGVSLIAYLATLTAGFIHLIGVISRYESDTWYGWTSVFAIAVGLIGTELSAVYGVVYEDLQTRVTGQKDAKEDITKSFLESIGIHSLIELSMWFMAVITGFANFLYSLYVVKEMQLANEGRKVGFVLLEHIIGPNTIDDHFAIDPITLMALFLFSTIIPVIMIVQSKMQIQFLRYIIKTIESIKRTRRNAENKVETIKQDKQEKATKRSKPVIAEKEKEVEVTTIPVVHTEPEVRVITRKPIIAASKSETIVKKEDASELVVDALSNPNKLVMQKNNS